MNVLSLINFIVSVLSHSVLSLINIHSNQSFVIFSQVLLKMYVRNVLNMEL